jgi:hypothetical protein
MGKHFVPKRHLRRFAIVDEPDQIWMYDKSSKILKKAAIEKVAQQAEFYDGTTEVQLNERVERPANPILDKLIRREVIDSNERVLSAAYIATMYSRVPQRRSEITNIVPSAAEKVLKEYADALEAWAKTNPDPNRLEQRREEFDRVSRGVRADPTRGAVKDLIRSPWPSQRIIGVIASMCWRIGRAPAPHFFITSDNPVHFFKWLGIGNPNSALTFPISAHVALFASWRGEMGSIQYVDLPSSFVKECNRRQANGATRFVFARLSESWITRLADNPTPRFNEIRW